MADDTINSSEWAERDELIRSFISFLDLDDVPDRYKVQSSKTCPYEVEWLQRQQGDINFPDDEEISESHRRTTSDGDDEQNLTTITVFDYPSTISLMPTLDEYLSQTLNISLSELFMGRVWTLDDSKRILNRMSQLKYEKETREEYNIRLCNEIYHDMRYLTDDGELPSDLSEEQHRGLFLEIYEKIQLATWDNIQEDEIKSITERVFDEGIGGRRGDEEDTEICIVCFGELYKEKETIRRLGCGHDYHDNCIEWWLQRKKRCPLCNFKVTTLDDGVDDNSDEHYSDYYDCDADDEDEEDDEEEDDDDDDDEDEEDDADEEEDDDDDDEEEEEEEEERN